MYANEQSFSKALTAKMKKQGVDYTRIESHGTANGIPDLFVMSGLDDMWIELKNDSTVFHTAAYIKVAWRPGQQAWFEQYRRHHISKRGVTLMSGADCIFIIPMDRLYSSNIVALPWYVDYATWKMLDIKQVLSCVCFKYKYPKCNTYREAFIEFMEIVYGPETLKAYDWDPEVAWTNAEDSWNLMLPHGTTIDSMFDEQIFNDNRWWLFLGSLDQMNVIR